ncbi:MAG TPA: AmmeMemoRadiSam system radical SAM enzyme [Clostridium sp.]|nr:AmmeMemoRadiSam system radical SAM enzyme [Clostridium sp.]
MDSKLLFYDVLKTPKNKNNKNIIDTKLDNTLKIRCTLCPHNCILTEGNFGACRLRTIKDSIPVTINYGEVASAGVDPIEKKPLYHFKPSKNILSLGSFGCNMTCSFCQNYEISQKRPYSDFTSVNKLISLMNTIDNNVGVAFTYNEPFMWYEYIYDVCKTIKEKSNSPNTTCGYPSDFSTVLVTNGYVNKEPLLKLLPYIDAMNIDLKAYTNKYYNKICGASLEPVLETIKRCNKKCHIEITTLLVSDENDSEKEAQEIAQFISSVDENIPLHLSRYFPRYKMENEATHIERLLHAQDISKKYLKYVYIGNVQGTDNNTYCPNCGTLLIERHNYTTKVFINENTCPSCKSKINIKL